MSNVYINKCIVMMLRKNEVMYKSFLGKTGSRELFID